MKPRNLILAAAAAVFCLAVLVQGCATPPTAPQVDPSGGSTSSSPPPDTTETASLDGVIRVTGSVLEPILSEVLDLVGTVEGLLGGEVRAGRFTVEVPPGAFDGVGSIEVKVPDTTRLHCSIEITPVDLNGFDEPVRLSVRLDGVENPARTVIKWWDPAGGKWEPVESKYDESRGVIEADLTHFSEYSVQLQSKAGW